MLHKGRWETHEKMFNITSHQENANLSLRFYYMPIRMAKIKF